MGNEDDDLLVARAAFQGDEEKVSGEPTAELLSKKNCGRVSKNTSIGGCRIGVSWRSFGSVLGSHQNLLHHVLICTSRLAHLVQHSKAAAMAFVQVELEPKA